MGTPLLLVALDYCQRSLVLRSAALQADNYGTGW
jgi:hypothetical protein